MSPILVAVLLHFMWDSSEEATYYTLYERVGTSWVQKGSTAQTDIRITATKGWHYYAVTASNQSGESSRSPTLSIRVRNR